MLFARRLRLLALAIVLCLLGSSALLASDATSGRTGYYRYPAVHGDTLIFTSEGDLWSVPLAGGIASRLTSASGVESMASISPDGQTVAFRAQYEGPSEVYTMPSHGGIPQRRTWSGTAIPDGWTPDGRLIVSTTRFSTLPDPRIVLLSTDGGREDVPLAGAAQAAFFLTVIPSSSPAGTSSPATPSATKAAPLKTSGATTAREKPSPSPPTTPEPRTTP